MKQLEKQLRKNGFEYDQVWRDEQFAIYSQSSEGKVIAYEVFKINHNQAREIMGNQIAASESVPPSTQWGTNAWTVYTMEQAEAKVAIMQENAVKTPAI